MVKSLKSRPEGPTQRRMARCPLLGLAETLRHAMIDELASIATLLEAHAEHDPGRASVYRAAAADFRAAARHLATVKPQRYSPTK